MKRLLLAASPFVLASCAEAPLQHDYKADPGPQVLTPPAFGEPGPIVPPVVEGGVQPFTGVVKDYVTNGPIAASISSYGIQPPLQAQSVATGDFDVQVPVQSVFWAKVYGPDLASTYEQVTTNNAPTQKDLYAVTTATLNGFATAFGKTQNPSCGVVITYVTKNGAGAEGVAGIDLGGVDAEGPYFLDANKAAAPALDATSTSGRAVFFNVCATGGGPIADGANALVLLDDPNAAAPPTAVRIFPGGVSLAKILADGTPQGPPGPPTPTLDFSTDIMPIFAQNGCAACHAEGGTAAGTNLLFNKEASIVWNALREGTSRVNLANPTASYLLSYPLLEEPPNHPNASFDSPQHPGYVRILQWIEEGAPYSPTNPTAPPVDVAVDFATDVYPVFQLNGRGCASCHNATDYSGNLDLTGGPEVVAQRIADKALVDINYADRSKLLRNPYCGPAYCEQDQYPETHPVRVFVSTDDPDYQAIYQWVLQGALYQPAPPVQPNPVLKTNVDFGSEVMIRLQARGCTGCHDANEVAGGLDLTGTPAQVLPRLLIEGRVQAGQPQTSYLLTKPLGTRPDVAHSGGKLIPNENDDFYLYVAGWVQEGALQNPPTPLTPVNFATQVFPLFAQQGCTGCHGAAGGDGGLNLDGDPATVRANVLNGRAVAYDVIPSTSAILTKPLAAYPNTNHGGGKLIQNTDYNYYKYLQRWLNEGAQ